MTNSDQEDNNSQPPAEVEDPITNPGKKEPVSTSDSATVEDEMPEAVKVTKNSANSKWMVITGVLGLLVVLYMFMTGNAGEGGAQNSNQTTNNDQTQGAGDALTGEGSPTNQTSEGGGEGLPVAQDNALPTNSEGVANEDGVLDSIELELNISVGSNEELIEAVTDILVLSDRLGPNDVLSINSEAVVNGNRIIRMQQSHLGIPVFGAVIVAVENSGNVGNVSGSTGNDIEISVDPELSFEEALSIANQTMLLVLSSRANTEAARLVILDVEGTYHLAWYSLLVVEGSEERVFLDAQDGSILMRLPVNIGEA